MTPYTMGEAKGIIRSHDMDLYHREIMAWLISEVERLQKQIVGHVERIAAQSELLSRKAEVPVTFRGVPIVGEKSLGEQTMPWVNTNVATGERFEVPFDGSTGLTNPVAGRKVEGGGS